MLVGVFLTLLSRFVSPLEEREGCCTCKAAHVAAMGLYCRDHGRNVFGTPESRTMTIGEPLPELDCGEGLLLGGSVGLGECPWSLRNLWSQRGQVDSSDLIESK